MKKLWLVIFMAIALGAQAQSFTEKIIKNFTFEKKDPLNTLIVADMNGSVEIEGYNGNEIMVEVTKTIRGKTETRLESGKKQVQLGMIDRADTIILFVEGLCSTFSQRKYGKQKHGEWGYHGDCNGGCHDDFDHTMNFKIKVPADIHVNASTINGGNVVVENVKGSVIANNINGSIKLTNLVREANASTINGDLDVVYASNPTDHCRFYSLNGNINAYFKKGLAASLSFESFNGDLFTNIQQIEALPVSVEKENGSKGVKYKIGGNRYKVGSGATTTLLDFETFNGNVYVKEN
jgi:DUF4097 and DUF4098 domain-containing protein YvlB